MGERYWVPDTIPIDRPSPARIYDYYLGGYHNFQPDREVADDLARLFPHVRLAAQANRAFLRRVVTFLVQSGCDQFLDLGSGIPTAGNVHEVACSINPDARVVYVDIDPVAVAHSQAMLAGTPNVAAIRADARAVSYILDHPDARRLLDLDRPLGLLMIALLHYIVDDEEAHAAAQAYRSAVVDGSYLAIAHTVVRDEPSDLEVAVQRMGKRSSPTRDRAAHDIQRFFGDWSFLPPGLVLTPLWRPEGPTDPLIDDPERAWALAGLAHKVPPPPINDRE